MKKLVGEIKKEIDEEKIISIHEHIYPERFIENYSLENILRDSYLYSDLVSSGMARDQWEEIVSSEGIDPSPPFASLEEILKAMKYVRATSYYRALFLGLKELYGIERLNEENFKHWDEIVREKRKNGWEKKVFETSKIKMAFIDNFWSLADFEFPELYFKPVFRVDRLVQTVDPELKNKKGLRAIELAERLGFDISSFQGYCEMVSEVLATARKKGVVAVKVALAYYRSLSFPEVSEEVAKRAYEKRDRNMDMEFSNYMMHFVLKECEELGFPVLFHTGLHTRNANIVSNSDPKLLNTLFLKYPSVNFILLHAGYPFSRECAVLAKNFPNVFLDVTWLPMVTETGFKNLLREVLELVPGNKITWGSDSYHVEQMLGHARIFRELLSSVLSEMALEGRLSTDEAIEVGRWILNENAEEIFLK
jgi:predicted TIM-barrel fold metal-dependent hydrolase